MTYCLINIKSNCPRNLSENLHFKQFFFWSDIELLKRNFSDSSLLLKINFKRKQRWFTYQTKYSVYRHTLPLAHQMHKWHSDTWVCQVHHIGWRTSHISFFLLFPSIPEVSPDNFQLFSQFCEIQDTNWLLISIHTHENACKCFLKTQLFSF